MFLAVWAQANVTYQCKQKYCYAGINFLDTYTETMWNSYFLKNLYILL